MGANRMVCFADHLARPDSPRWRPVQSLAANAIDPQRSAEGDSITAKFSGGPCFRDFIAVEPFYAASHRYNLRSPLRQRDHFLALAKVIDGKCNSTPDLRQSRSDSTRRNRPEEFSLLMLRDLVTALG